MLNSSFTLVTRPKEISYSGIYIGDVLSVAMAKAERGNAWITVMSHMNVVAVAVLKGISCIIVCEDFDVDEAVISKANLEGISIFKTSLSCFYACMELCSAGESED